ncbi:hypothetical protein R3P38DRAFT_3240631 [Favolaschia claudopus]|uniref:Uncharacterized protein n=1 Tax=Favolaschia claudopus TaxID=2862362 RepID=A0AAV9Z672_9AGAR
MPKIRHFHVPIAGHNFETELFPLPSVASRLPLIQDMTIHLGTLDPPRLLEALQAFPALTKLVVYANVWYGRWDDLPAVPCGTTWILECLADTTVCPRLQELEVVKAESLSKPILDAFLGARAGLESSSRLRCLTVNFGSSWNDTQYPEQFPTPTETENYLSHGLTVLFYRTSGMEHTLVFALRWPTPRLRGAVTGLDSLLVFSWMPVKVSFLW